MTWWSYQRFIPNHTSSKVLKIIGCILKFWFWFSIFQLGLSISLKLSECSDPTYLRVCVLHHALFFSSSSSFIFSFFSNCSFWLFSSEQCTVHYLQVLQTSLFNHFFIKNRSHGTIHIFNNYFATVFSVFNKNKLYSNRPLMSVWQKLFLLTYFTVQLIFTTIHWSYCTFGTIHESYYIISANFYLHLQYFQQKVFNFSKINRL